MKLAIVGVGAIGSVIGAFLARAGVDVTLICRGAQLEAIRSNGLRLKSAGEDFVVRPTASDRPEDFGRQDGIILTAKTYSLAELAPRLKSMTGPDTAIVSTQNGIPWWYLYGAPGPGADQPLEAADPGGVLWRTIGPEHAVAGSVLLPAIMERPGVVNLGAMATMVLGAPKGGHQAFIDGFIKAAAGSGLTTQRADAHASMWAKLRVLLPGGPVSAVTQSSLAALSNIAGVIEMQDRLAGEVTLVARAWGIDLPPLAKRLPMPPGALTHMSSMWQDYESGKPLELDPILLAPIELGRRRGVDTPAIQTLLALLRARVAWRDAKTKVH